MVQLRSGPIAMLIVAGYFWFYAFQSLFLLSGHVSTHADEIAILLLLIVAALSGAAPSRRLLLACSGFAVFVFFSVFSTHAAHLGSFPKYRAMLVGLAVDIKPLLAFVSLSLALFKTQGTRYLRWALLSLVGVALVDSAFVLRDVLVGGTNIHGLPMERSFGLPEATGVFFHKVESAQMCLIGFIAALSLLFEQRGDRTHWLNRPRLLVVTVYLGFIVLVHVSVKEVGAAFVITGLALWSTRKLSFGSKALAVIAAVFLVGIAIGATNNPFSQRLAAKAEIFVFSEQASTTVRNSAYRVSLQIAADHFPFGTGAGTFLSKPSRELGYSPVYEEYGMSRLYGGSRDTSWDLLDVFWPKILGESGVVGFLGYLTFYGVMIFTALLVWKRGVTTSSFFSLGILTSALIVSLADSTIPNQRFAIVVGLAGALAIRDAAIWRRERRELQAAGRPIRTEFRPGDRPLVT